MFYAARALLLTRDVRRSKHAAVIAAFGAEFVRSGELPADLFACFRDGFEGRAESDYGFDAVSEERARQSLEAATRFVRTVAPRLAGFLGGAPPSPET
jgi:uncharacterized protein (UPF0332 family)